MKDFSDLVFEPHSMGSGFHAKHYFENGNVISVIAGEHFYSSPRKDLDNPQDYTHYEVMYWIDSEPIDEVLPFSSVEEIEKLINFLK